MRARSRLAVALLKIAALFQIVDASQVALANMLRGLHDSRVAAHHRASRLLGDWRAGRRGLGICDAAWSGRHMDRTCGRPRRRRGPSVVALGRQGAPRFCGLTRGPRPFRRRLRGVRNDWRRLSIADVSDFRLPRTAALRRDHRGEGLERLVEKRWARSFGRRAPHDRNGGRPSAADGRRGSQPTAAISAPPFSSIPTWRNGRSIAPGLRPCGWKPRSGNAASAGADRGGGGDRRRSRLSGGLYLLPAGTGGILLEDRLENHRTCRRRESSIGSETRPRGESQADYRRPLLKEMGRASV